MVLLRHTISFKRLAKRLYMLHAATGLFSIILIVTFKALTISHRCFADLRAYRKSAFSIF